MFEQTDRKPQPRLLQLSEDGNAKRPDELENVPVVILDSIDVTTRDGRDSAQWVVRTPDQQTAVYWAAGKGPMIAVRHWFHENPRTPLYAQLERRTDRWGNNIWYIQQRFAEPTEDSTIDSQLDAAGFLGQSDESGH